MEENRFKKMTDDELVNTASTTTIGTASGHNAQGAQAELIRRNTEALEESKKSADRSSGIMFDLTLILMIIAVIQVVVGIFSLDIENYLKITITIVVLGLLGLLFKDFIRDWRKDKD